MRVFARIAQERIGQAMEDGAFENLKNAVYVEASSEYERKLWERAGI